MRECQRVHNNDYSKSARDSFYLCQVTIVVVVVVVVTLFNKTLPVAKQHYQLNI